MYINFKEGKFYFFSETKKEKSIEINSLLYKKILKHMTESATLINEKEFEILSNEINNEIIE